MIYARHVLSRSVGGLRQTPGPNGFGELPAEPCGNRGRRQAKSRMLRKS